MENDFTKQKAIGTFIGAVLLVLLLNVLEFTGYIGWWQVLMAIITSIEVGCWVGAPVTTREIHQAIFSRTHIPKVLLSMSVFSFAFIHYELYLLTLKAVDFLMAVTKPYEIFREYSFLHQLKGNPQSTVVWGMMCSFVVSWILLSSMDWEKSAPKFSMDERKWSEKIFLLLLWDVAVFPVFFILVSGFFTVFLPLMFIAMIYSWFVGGYFVIKLAGHQQTLAIVFGVMVGGLAGAAMGWTHLVLLPTITVMTIGGCVGAGSGFLLTKLGQLLINWEQKSKQQAVTG